MTPEETDARVMIKAIKALEKRVEDIEQILTGGRMTQAEYLASLEEKYDD